LHPIGAEFGVSRYAGARAYPGEDMMELAAVLVETLDSAPDAPVDRTPNFSPPSPEEGHRLMRDFLRVKRSDLRERVFEFVAEILSVQERG
jgi:hypothetical protein